jgi:hypothetical protein
LTKLNLSIACLTILFWRWTTVYIYVYIYEKEKRIVHAKHIIERRTIYLWDRCRAAEVRVRRRRLIIIDVCRYGDDDNETKKKERQIVHLRMSDVRVYKRIYTTNYICFFFKTFYSIRIIVVIVIVSFYRTTIVTEYKWRWE